LKERLLLSLGKFGSVRKNRLNVFK